MVIFGVSSRLSLIVGGSSTKASLGGVSGAEADVTQVGGGPEALDADQPAGSAGGTTPSKFSLSKMAEHGVPLPVAVAVAVPAAVAVAAAVEVEVAVGTGDAVDVAVAVAVANGLGVGQVPHVPLTLKMMCMFGKPMVARSVGVVIPQSAALM